MASVQRLSLGNGTEDEGFWHMTDDPISSELAA